MVVDIFFLFDLVLNFFLKVKISGSDENNDQRSLITRYDIARNYILGWFIIDLVSVVPVDVISMSFETGSSSIEAVKLVRLLRLIKLMRFLRASRMMARWSDHFHLTYTMKDLLRLIFLLLFSSHLMACFWGLVGHFNLDMDCTEGYPILKSSSKDTVLPDDSMDANWNWIAASYKAPSPDNMCDPWIVYIWALHFSVKTITSIGYGDISPQRQSEYVVCIFCMFWGGILWAYTIGNICATLGSADSDELSFRVQYDQLNEMMDDQNIQHDLRIRVRRYMKEATHAIAAGRHQEFEEILGDVVGMRLHREVATHLLYFRYVCNVPIFNGLGTDFTVQVSRALEPEFFAPKETIPPYFRLWLIIRGAAIFEGLVHVRGMHLREDFFLDSMDLQLSSNCNSEAAAITYCNALKFTKASFVDLLSDYPYEFKIIRKRSLLMMFRNAGWLFVRQARERMPDKNISNLIGRVKRDDSQYRYRKVHEQNIAARLFGNKLLSDVNGRFESAPPQERTDAFGSAQAGKEEPGVGESNNLLTLLNEVEHHEVDLKAAYAQIAGLDSKEEYYRATSTRLVDENAQLSRKIQALENEVSHLRTDLANAGNGNEGSVLWPTDTSVENPEIAKTLRNLQERRQKRDKQMSRTSTFEF
jgi:hypothetical protein